jgi:GNAT superfamily N-acetyltransferase
MFVRFGLAHEEDLFVDMARIMQAESYPDLPFSEQRTRETYRSYLKTAQPTFFFCDDGKGGVAGILEASISAYQFADGIYTTLCGTFVHPDKRGTRAAALLLSAFTRWTDQLGAIESTGGNDNNLTTERTTRLLGHFGFAPVGTFVRRKRGG